MEICVLNKKIKSLHNLIHALVGLNCVNKCLQSLDQHLMLFIDELDTNRETIVPFNYYHFVFPLDTFLVITAEYS